ncbi:acyltransferase [Clostridium sp. PL3]|uniref:Acyltransferase n=1 Tax=Clostridium thailandense TaxID=2794346 RepID=A0A949WQJ1_9CLOT|nr:acyltransferase [Clostridium thailandense]MBV7272841.1 acyltransferase [Clostridium thailandense]
MRQERLHEIDILRAIAFVFVVTQHTLGGFSNIKGLPYASFAIMKLTYVIAKVAVPIFLFISAVALFYTHSEKFECKSYYFKRIKYLLIPYIVWSAINMIMLDNKERFNNFLIQLIAGNAAYHFWYMGMVIRVFFMFPIILCIAKKVHLMNVKIRTSIFILLVCLYYPVSRIQNTISDNVGKLIFGTPTDIQQRIINISVLFWYLYFILGIYLALNYEYIKKKLIQYRAIVFIIYGISLIYAYLNEIEKIRFIRFLSLSYMVFSVLTFYLIALSLKEKNKVYKLMKFISDYSFTSYMAHIIVINYVVNITMLVLNTRNYLIVGIFALVITSLTTPVIIKFISYFPFSEYITGTKRSFKSSVLKIRPSKTA